MFHHLEVGPVSGGLRVSPMYLITRCRLLFRESHTRSFNNSACALPAILKPQGWRNYGLTTFLFHHNNSALALTSSPVDFRQRVLINNENNRLHTILVMAHSVFSHSIVTRFNSDSHELRVAPCLAPHPHWHLKTPSEDVTVSDAKIGGTLSPWLHTHSLPNVHAWIGWLSVVR